MCAPLCRVATAFTLRTAQVGPTGKVVGIDVVPEVVQPPSRALCCVLCAASCVPRGVLPLVTPLPTCPPLQLVEQSIVNTRKHHADKLESGNVVLRVGDGYAGEPAEGPYDAIHVGAAAPEIPPALIEQVGCVLVRECVCPCVCLFYCV